MWKSLIENYPTLYDRNNSEGRQMNCPFLARDPLACLSSSYRNHDVRFYISNNILTVTEFTKFSKHQVLRCELYVRNKNIQAPPAMADHVTTDRVEWGAVMSVLAAPALITAFVSLIPESGPHSHSTDVYQNPRCFSINDDPSDKILFSASQNLVEKKSSSTVGNAAASTCAWVSLKKENTLLAFSLCKKCFLYCREQGRDTFQWAILKS